MYLLTMAVVMYFKPPSQHGLPRDMGLGYGFDTLGIALPLTGILTPLAAYILAGVKF